MADEKDEQLIFSEVKQDSWRFADTQIIKTNV